MLGHRKKSDREVETHQLETREGGSCQDIERRRQKEGSSLPGDRKGRDLSGLERSDHARGTHSLETAEAGICEDTGRKRSSKGHSLPGDRGWRDLSRHRKKATERRALTLWRPRDISGHGKKVAERRHSLPGDHRGRDLSGHRKKPTGRVLLTIWKPEKEGLVMTRKKGDRLAMSTHDLETGKGRTCQDTEL